MTELFGSSPSFSIDLHSALLALWTDCSDLKQPSDMTDNEEQFWRILPAKAVKGGSKSIFKEKIPNVPAFLKKISYKIPFDRVSMEALLVALSSGNSTIPSKLLVIAGTFQTISRIFLTKEPITPNEFSLLMHILERQPLEPYTLLVFDSLIKSHRNCQWTQENISLVEHFFKNRASQTPELGDTLKCFIDQVMELDDREFWKSIVVLVLKLIQENAAIVKTREAAIFMGMPRIEESLVFGDEKAVLLLAICIPSLGDEYDRYFRLLICAYIEWAKRGCPEIVPEDPEVIHELSSTFEKVVCPSEEIADTGVFDFNSWSKNFASDKDGLYRRVPDAVVSKNKMIADFLGRIQSDARIEFCRIIQTDVSNCTKEEKYKVLTCWLMTLEMSGLPELLEETFATLCDSDMFDEKRTIYGPTTSDFVTDAYRYAVIHLYSEKAPKLVQKLLEEKRQCPFLLAEIAGRLCFEQSFDMNLLADRRCVTAFGDCMTVLRVIGADTAPRTPLFMIMCEYLRQKVHWKGRLIISEMYFTQAFLRFLYEKGLVNVIFLSLRKFFTSLGGDDFKDEDPSVILYQTNRFLLNYLSNAPEMKGDVFEFVRNTVHDCSYLARAFEVFLDLSMKELSIEKNDVTFSNAITLLQCISAAHSDFVLSPDCLRILADVVGPEHYTVILNLIAGSFSVSSRSLFLIQRPSFLPLMFAALGKDETKMNEFLLFLRTITKNTSNYNMHKLHEGGVDSLLLKWLKHGSPVLHKGAKIHISMQRQLALEILELIAATVSDSSVARKFLNAINSAEDRDIISVLHNSLHLSQRWFSNEFTIGTVAPFGKVYDIMSKDIQGSFTISFWVYLDTSVLVGLTSIVNIVSFWDKKDTTFSISLINDSLFVVYDGRAEKLLLSLFQRMSSNEWTHFVVMFDNQPDISRHIVRTVKDGTPVSESNFQSMSFDSSHLEVCLGGHVLEHRRSRYLNTGAGKAANISMFNRIVDETEIEPMMNENWIPPDYLFSVTDLSGQNGTKSARKIELLENYVQHDSILEPLQLPPNLRKLMMCYVKTREPKLLSVFSMAARSTRDKRLPSEVASILLQQFSESERNFALYRMFFEIVRNIAAHDIQELWFEDILINVDIWNVRDVRLITHWSTVLLSTFESIFRGKSYFRYFLTRLENPIPEAVKFMERIGYWMNVADATSLALMCIKHKDSPSLSSVYFGMMFVLSSKIVDLKFNLTESLLDCVSSSECNLILELRVFQVISQDKFCILIPKILPRLQRDRSLKILQEAVTNHSEFIPLLCALCLAYPELSLSDGFTAGKMGSRPCLWYLYPALLYLKSNGKVREDLCQFLVMNVYHSVEDMYNVLYLLMLVSEYTCFEFPAIENLIEGITKYKPNPKRAVKHKLFWLVITSCMYKLRPHTGYANIPHLVEVMSEYGFLDGDRSLYQYQKTVKDYSDPETIKKVILDGLNEMTMKLEVNPDNGKFVRIAIELANSVGRRRFSVARQSQDPKMASSQEYTLAEAASSLQLFSSREKDTVSIEDFATIVDVIENMTAIVSEDYRRWAKALRTSLGEMDIQLDKTLKDTATPGRASGKLNVKRQVQKKRSNQLSKLCPRNIVREKSQSPVTRLLATSSRHRPNAQRISFTRDPIDVYLTINEQKREIHILNCATRASQRVQLSGIKKVIYVEDGTTLIVTEKGQPFLFGGISNPTSVSEKIRTMSPRIRIFGTSMTDMTNYFFPHMSRWCNREITSFRYLCILNELAGRTYESRSRYPVFPSLDCDFLSCSDVSLPTIDSSLFSGEKCEHAQTGDRLLVLPELYYYSEACDSIDEVYANRKRLEECPNLEQWVQRVFGGLLCNLINPDTFPEHSPRRPPASVPSILSLVNIIDDPSQSLLFCSSIRAENGLPAFASVDATGKVTFSALKIVNGEVKCQVIKHEPLSRRGHRVDPSTLKFFPTKDGVLAYDGRFLIKATRRKPTATMTMFNCPNPWFSDDLCQVTRTKIFKYSRVQSDAKIQRCMALPLINLPDVITCIAVSNRFHIIVVGCEDSMLRIRSMTGVKVATVSLDDEVPISVLISNEWGFIVAKTSCHLFVFDVNGKLVRKVPNTASFITWNTFTTRDGFDYIVYTDAVGLYFFEIMNPTKLTHVNEYSPDIIHVSYGAKHGCLFIVYRSGKTIITSI